jgi:hypothetical protein
MTVEGNAAGVEERIGQAAATSREEAANVGETVQAEAKEVATKVKTQAESAMRQIVDDARQQAEGQAAQFAESMRQAGEQLRTMADAGEGQSIATTLVREEASAAERLADRLDDGGIEGALAEVRAFARRSPGAFLLGAAAVGFVTGRLVRNFSAPSGAPTAVASEAEFTPALDSSAADDADDTRSNAGAS